MRKTRLKLISPRQKAKQDNWNRLVAFLVVNTATVVCGIRTECCNKLVWSISQVDGAHIIGKTRPGCTWTAKNCLLVSRWCGCHSHQEYGDGLRMGIVAALEIAGARNKKYKINPEYNGSKEMSPYLEEGE